MAQKLRTRNTGETPRVEGAVWIRKWAGGRVRMARGREVWVIERSGRVLTLNVASERDAMVELALFETDPVAYRTRAQRTAAAPGRVVLDVETLSLFAAHCAKQGLSEGYRKHILGRYLADWGVALRGRDLRTVALREVVSALDGWKTARHHRIVALKAFTAWARETAQLRRGDDPTVDLRVPPARAEKSLRPKGYPMRLVERLYAEISSQALRDTICLRAKTGMHDSEISRIARGEARLKRLDDPSGIAGTITFRHKTGKVHVVSVDAQTFAAAERLAVRGPLSRNAAKVMLDRVAIRWHGCDGVTRKRTNARGEHVWETRPCPGCELFRPGELRHSFATWARAEGRLVRAREGGVPLAEVAAVMGHFSARTTATFYEGGEVPAMLALPLRLEHAEDPAK